MSLKIVFLGTAASIPTSTRALSSVAVQRNGEVFLFDCGECAQRQIIRARIGLNRKTRIFITHMHGDHVLGLPGLLQTMSLLGRDKPLYIYGPAGIRAFVDAMIGTVKFMLIFPVEVKEVEKAGIICEEKEFQIETTFAEHSTTSLAYALVEKTRPGRFHPERAVLLGIPKGPLWSRLQQGFEATLSNGRKVKPEEVLGPPRPSRKIVYTGDTRPSDNIIRLAELADVLIHEATFSDDMLERAKEDMHSTPSEVADVAKKAKARLLVLTHISARYGETESLIEEAKKIFRNIRIAKDFMKMDIPLKKD